MKMNSSMGELSMHELVGDFREPESWTNAKLSFGEHGSSNLDFGEHFQEKSHKTPSSSAPSVAASVLSTPAAVALLLLLSSLSSSLSWVWLPFKGPLQGDDYVYACVARSTELSLDCTWQAKEIFEHNSPFNSHGCG